LKNEIILITGASGCVGQYIVNWLIQNSSSELFLWVRDPKKITSINLRNPRIKVLVGDLRQPNKFKEEISKSIELFIPQLLGVILKEPKKLILMQ